MISGLFTVKMTPYNVLRFYFVVFGHECIYDIMLNVGFCKPGFL